MSHMAGGTGEGVTGRDVHGRYRREIQPQGPQMLHATSLEGLVKRDEDLVGIAVELSPHPPRTGRVSSRKQSARA